MFKEHYAHLIFFEVVELLNREAYIEATNFAGVTPLLQACFHGRRTTVQLLLDKNADLYALKFFLNMYF